MLANTMGISPRSDAKRYMRFSGGVCAALLAVSPAAAQSITYVR
jgi:hypothetical protein